jgi:pyruvate dehydrogenase E2 component (dihydrolipoamide acetyltransferase)
MTIFKLPDLGEGLPEAEIHEWFVKVGDHVVIDQPLVSMETAKAIVEVPAPQTGIIEAFFGNTGDVIKTGSPLIRFRVDADAKTDQGTVVGHLVESQLMQADEFIIGGQQKIVHKATPVIRLMAKKNGVNMALVHGTGPDGLITVADIEQAVVKKNQLPEGYRLLQGVRKAMQANMSLSHKQVVPVSIFDEADIEAWSESNDITVRLIKAIGIACHAEPALNAWFDGDRCARKTFDQVHLGLAMDTKDGLFVPVISDITHQNDEALRSTINQYKSQVHKRILAPEQFKGATLTLSNFGKFAGRFASPIIVPPMVAIIAVGRMYEKVVWVNQQPENHRILPLSLSFDHRAVTGGEATRFLGVMIEALSAP